MDTVQLKIQIENAHNRVILFGPHERYPKLCEAFSVEKLSLWVYADKHHMRTVVLKGVRQMSQARLAGMLYNLTDEEMYSLDRRMGLEVECYRRKFPVKPAVYMQDSDGGEYVPYAWFYLGHTKYWLDRIHYDTRIAPVPGFSRLKPTYHPDRLLNGYHTFFPPPYNPQPVRPVLAEVEQRVRERNDAAIQAFRIERMLKEKTDRKENWKRKVKDFLNE